MRAGDVLVGLFALLMIGWVAFLVVGAAVLHVGWAWKWAQARYQHLRGH